MNVRNWKGSWPEGTTCIAQRPTPVWVKIRHSPGLSGCPLYPRKRTSKTRTVMSALGHFFGLMHRNKQAFDWEIVKANPQLHHGALVPGGGAVHSINSGHRRLAGTFQTNAGVRGRIILISVKTP